MVAVTLPLLAALAELAVFVVAVLVFLGRRRARAGRVLPFLGMAISFLAIGSLTFLAAFGNPVPLLTELDALQTMLWAVLLAGAVADMARVRTLKVATFFVLGGTLLAFLFLSPLALLLLELLAFFLAALAFFALSSLPSPSTRWAGVLGLGAAFLFTILSLAPVEQDLRAFPLVLLAGSLGCLLRSNEAFGHFFRPSRIERVEKGRDHPGPLHAFAYIASYLLLLNIAVFTTGIALHELGHLAFGQILGCSGGRIILFDLAGGGPFTEIRCPPYVFRPYLGLSGFPFILLFAAAFLALRRFPERNLGMVTLGNAFLLAGLDIGLVSSSPLAPPLLLLLGMVAVLVGEIKLIDAYLRSPPRRAPPGAGKEPPAPAQGPGGSGAEPPPTPTPTMKTGCKSHF